MSIDEYFGRWRTVVDTSLAARTLQKAVLYGPLCPLPRDAFRCFKLCPYDSLRVVILGQDPYPQRVNGYPIATGIAFANDFNTPPDSYSPSLKVLKDSVINFFYPQPYLNFDPTFGKWEKQGVLMLNSALTCKAGSTGSQALLWRPFVASLLKQLSLYRTGLVYVLMGSVAQSFEPLINHESNFVIKTKHPSWYARTGCCFPYIWGKINTILKGQNGYGINWYEEHTEQENT